MVFIFPPLDFGHCKTIEEIRVQIVQTIYIYIYIYIDNTKECDFWAL
jgi:hypothetical protein